MGDINSQPGIHQGQPVFAAGTLLEKATAAMILVHGRGASAESILELGEVLNHPGVAYLAPQAAGSTWYPYSFLAPLAQNEPDLSSALQKLGDLVGELERNGISADRTFIGGFSQGACLAAEFAARNARRFAGLLLFSGGVIGPPGTPRLCEGSLAGTPVFLGCSDVDPHIPLFRVNETAEALQSLGANVELQIYPGMPHTINEDEIRRANQLISRELAAHRAGSTRD